MADDLPAPEESDSVGGMLVWIAQATEVLQSLVLAAGATPIRDASGAPGPLIDLAHGPLPDWVRQQVPEFRCPAEVFVTTSFTLPSPSSAVPPALYTYAFKSGDGNPFVLLPTDAADTTDIPLSGLSVGADETVSFQVSRDGNRWVRVDNVDVP